MRLLDVFASSRLLFHRISYESRNAIQPLVISEVTFGNQRLILFILYQSGVIDHRPTLSFSGRSLNHSKSELLESPI
jgi:hypothetical protein